MAIWPRILDGRLAVARPGLVIVTEWIVFAISWMVAARWSNPVEQRPGVRREILYRAILIAGGLILAIPAHGYRGQRADVLTLVTALQEQQFNAYLFDFTGHGTSAGVTTLGYKETAELRAAVQSLSARDDVDPRRFGLWGEDMGGYAALEVATSDPRIAAIAVDNAYSDPSEMVEYEVKQSGLAALPGVSAFSDWGFHLLNYSYRDNTPASERLGQLKGIPKLFIETEDRPELAQYTLRLFNLAPEPKQLIRKRLNYSDMGDEDRKNYESQIVSFFLQSLPPASRR